MNAMPSANSDDPSPADTQTFRVLHVTTNLDHMLFIAPLAAKLRSKLGLPDEPVCISPSLPPEMDINNLPWEKVPDRKPFSQY